MFKKMGKMGPIVLLILFILIALYLGSKTSYLTSIHSSSVPLYEGLKCVSKNAKDQKEYDSYFKKKEPLFKQNCNQAFKETCRDNNCSEGYVYVDNNQRGFFIRDCYNYACSKFAQQKVK